MNLILNSQDTPVKMPIVTINLDEKGYQVQCGQSSFCLEKNFCISVITNN